MKYFVIVALWVVATHGEPRSDVALANEYKQMLKRVAEFPVKGWSKRDSFMNFEGRAASFKFHLKDFLGEDRDVAEILAENFLTTKDPVSSCVAFEHLVEWARGKKDPDFAFESDAELSLVVRVTQPYPLEYALVFEQVYDFATDKISGMGLTGNAALEFTLKRFTDPEALVNLTGEKESGAFKRGGIDEVIAEHTREPLQRWKNARLKYDGMPEKELLDKGTRSPLLKLDAPAFLRKKLSTAFSTKGKADALTSYAEFVRHAVDEVGSEVFDANQSALNVFDKHAADNFRSVFDTYLRAYEFAKDPHFGLGMAPKEAHRFASSVARDRDGETRLKRFLSELVKKSSVPELKDSAEKTIRDAATEAGIANAISPEFSLPPENRLVKSFREAVAGKETEVAGETAKEKKEAPRKKPYFSVQKWIALLATGSASGAGIYLYRRSRPCQYISVLVPPVPKTEKTPEQLKGFDDFVDFIDDFDKDALLPPTGFKKP